MWYRRRKRRPEELSRAVADDFATWGNGRQVGFQHPYLIAEDVLLGLAIIAGGDRLLLHIPITGPRAIVASLGEAGRNSSATSP